MTIDVVKETYANCIRLRKSNIFLKGPLSEDFDRLDSDNDGVLTVAKLSMAKLRRRKSH